MVPIINVIVLFYTLEKPLKVKINADMEKSSGKVWNYGLLANFKASFNPLVFAVLLQDI